MAKVLLIKTTSMGDLIHTMPAVTDLAAARPDIELHWLVEESFAGIPLWHPFVQKVHTCAIRRWRKSLLNSKTRAQIRQLKAELRREQYDLVVDAQGLVKSAWMVRWLSGEKHGYDKHSIKEPLASLVYDKKHTISRDQGAITRNRQLLSAALGYNLPRSAPDFGLAIEKPSGFAVDTSHPFAVFLHGTNWPSKIWPAVYWRQLAGALGDKGMTVFVPWGNDEEKQRAESIAADNNAVILPRQSLTALAYLLQNANLVVGSDTGLSHLAAALDTLTIGLYGSTSVELTGLIGPNVVNLEADMDCSPCLERQCRKITSPDQLIPCYSTIGPEKVLQTIREQHG